MGVALFVKDSFGKTHYVEVDLDSVVHDIKKSLAKEMDVDPRAVQLSSKDELLDDDEMPVSDIANLGDMLYAETSLAVFRFLRCGSAGDIEDAGMRFSLVRTRPDYAVAVLEPSIQVGETTTWAIRLSGSPRIDFGVSTDAFIDLNNHCRNNKNHIWHITGMSRTLESTYLAIYGDDSSGHVTYDPDIGVVVQMTLTSVNSEGILTCEFQDVSTRARLPCTPQPITGIRGPAHPIWCFDDAASAEIVPPST
ncbi:hypothetical protein DIPPA_10845 [Diplonema papillatum]|nr:hypothetical protein DIPPA_10845 [Diplonema papillatum]